MKKVVILYYAKANLGDDVLVKVLCDRYTNPFTTLTTRHILTVSGIPNLSEFRVPYLSYVLTKLYEIVINKRNYLLGRLLRSNDLLVYVGGSIFMEEENLPRWRRDRNFFTKLKKPYYIIGANFGPYKTEIFLEYIREILSHAVDVCFRDEYSRKVYDDIKQVRASTDVAFSLDTSKYHVQNKKSVIISIINARNRFSEKDAKTYFKQMARLAELLLEKGYEVTLMSFCKHEGDEIAAQEIQSSLPVGAKSKVRTYYYRGKVDEALGLIASSEIVIGARFHATILGLVFNKKVLPVIYSDKTKNILEDMKFDGLTMDMRDPGAFDVENFNPRNLKIFSVKKQATLAKKQFKELDNVLDLRGNNE